MAKKTTYQPNPTKRRPPRPSGTRPRAADPTPAGDGGGAQAGRPMDLPFLEQLGRLMSDNDLSLVDLRDGKRRIYLRRGAVGPAQPAQPAAAPAPAAQPPQPPQPAAPAEAPPPPAADGGSGGREIVSPMVGTFYASPKPEDPPFVQVGSQVSADSDVCIIEAMKVFNNIKAELDGVISKVLVKNGESVEFGQPLFLVKEG